jgi:pilus assembly protein CpaB
LKLSIVLSLCGSLALGGAALLVAKVWLPSGTPKASASALPQANLVSVVVATSPLPYGTRLEASKLALRQYPADAVPEGAFTTIDQVMTTDHGGAPLVLTAMAARETILPAKISGPGAKPSVAVQITEGMRGYAIAVTDATGVGGNALPGDWVDVIMTRETNSEASDKGLISQVVVQNVRVLGVDLNADPASTQTAVRRTATLEVKPEDAQKLALSTQLGELSLALRKTGSAELAAFRSMRAGDVGSSAVRVAAAGSSRSAPRRTAGAVAMAAPPPAPPPPPVTRSITIINGGAPSRVSVPIDKSVSGAAG